jgi:hypothetical protein
MRIAHHVISFIPANTRPEHLDEEDGPLVFAEACRLGLEDIVSKRGKQCRKQKGQTSRRRVKLLGRDLMRLRVMRVGVPRWAVVFPCLVAPVGVDKQVKLYSRPGNDLTYRFPLIVEALARLRPPGGGPCVSSRHY